MSQDRMLLDSADEKLFDVIEVEIPSGKNLSVIAENKTRKNAEAIIKLAVMRRGVERSFFTVRPAIANGASQ